MFSKKELELAKLVVEAIKKISKGKWEWESEVGEWCIFRKKLFLVQRTHFISPIILLYLSDNYYNHPTWIKIESVTPLLHWERIEEILEGMGYYVRVLRNVDKDPNGNHLCECAIDRNEGHIAKVVDKTRQLAVMRAAIELGG